MSKTMNHNRNRSPYDLDELFVRIHRSPAGVTWRWRTEILTAQVLLAALFWLAGRMHSFAWALIALAALTGFLFAIPRTRRFVIGRFWCVVTRHRFHRLCWEARLHTRSGRIPLVLWVRPTKVGERLFVWCRAGVAAEDFEARTGELRAACYAREARVTRNTRWSQIVTIDIIRHDTLAASHTVASTLLHRLTVRSDPDGLLTPGGAGHRRGARKPKTVIPGHVIPPQAPPADAAGTGRPRSRPHKAVIRR